MFFDNNPELIYFTTETGAPAPTPSAPAPPSTQTPMPSTPTPTPGGPNTLPTPTPETAPTPLQGQPSIPLPSPNSPLVLPGEPNPEGKPPLIPLYQEIAELFQRYLKDVTNIGYLVAQVTTAYTNLPIKNAKVTISKPIGYDTYLSQIKLTDENGKTEPVSLPSRSPELSLQPGFPVPYTIYNLTVEAPGYYTVEVLDIPIFPGVTSIQPVNLIPTSIVQQNPSEVITDQPPSI